MAHGTYSYDDYLLTESNEKTIKSHGSGTGASTTGNIYGIYDMNGGGWEYVMGNMATIDGDFNTASAGTWTTEVYPDAKYYDFYSYGQLIMVLQPINEASWETLLKKSF